VVFLFPRQQISNPNEETKMSKRFTLKTLAAVGAMAMGTLLVSTGAMAQQKLKWAHVYETSEPYHTESVWAAEEIKKRSNGKFDIQVHAGQRDRHQPGPDPGYGGHDHQRLVFCGTQLPTVWHRLLPLHLSG
jgi:hypothetical protein